MIKNEQELNEKIEHCSSCLDEKFAPTGIFVFTFA